MIRKRQSFPSVPPHHHLSPLSSPQFLLVDSICSVGEQVGLDAQQGMHTASDLSGTLSCTASSTNHLCNWQLGSKRESPKVTLVQSICFLFCYWFS